MIASVMAGVVIIIGVLTVMRVRRRRRRDAGSIVEVEGKAVALPDATWAVASAIGAQRISKALSSQKLTTASDMAQTLITLTENLTPEERAAMARQLRWLRRAHAERELWELQLESIPTAAATGTLDAIILAAGQDPGWVAHLLESAVNSVDLSHLAIGELVTTVTQHSLQILSPDLFDHVVENLDSVIGASVDGAAEASIDGAAHALGAIADAHLPLVTLLRAAHRASKSSRAGLDPGRVRENLALDAGFGGGGLVAGAAIGTAFLPVVGTVIGGVIGSLVGKGSASHFKTRHLRDAQARVGRCMEAVGMSVSEHSWLRLAEQHQAMIAELDHCADSIQAASHALKRGVVPPLAHYVLAASARVGRSDIEQLRGEAQTWEQELAGTSGPGAASFRGALLLTRPDLQERLAVRRSLVKDATDAAQGAAEERRKLALANG